MQHIDSNSKTRSVVAGLCIVMLMLISSCKNIGSGEPPTACEQNSNSIACQCELNDQSKACICGLDNKSEACLCFDSDRGTGLETIGCFCARNPGNSDCPADNTTATEKGAACADLPAENYIKRVLLAVDAGDWGIARQSSQCAVSQDPRNVRASMIKYQLDRGASYFSTPGSTPYTVQTGDTLAGIAKRCLRSKNSDEFIALALYNQIVKPSSLLPGTVIRIPGNQSCEDADALIQKANEALNRGDLRTAVSYARRAYQLTGTAEHKQFLEELTAALISDLHKDAQLKLENGECNEARALWREILQYDNKDVQATYYLENINC